MVRSYVQTPENWDRITRTIVYNKEECLQSMVCAGKCLFLDTCTIMQYENLSTDSKFYQYISDTYDMVLVTRTILMELTSEDKDVYKRQSNTCLASLPCAKQSKRLK